MPQGSSSSSGHAWALSEPPRCIFQPTALYFALPPLSCHTMQLLRHAIIALMWSNFLNNTCTSCFIEN
ncbi:hypothetical protein PAXRUDRAFT_401311 [Paxillus rubicundulus Ve08.2h10]|uniref:Uncharacterized protein n=1 Tax=Paxillus rubicundulus Ve08.2h10 TaxID=930991 RepID=A0A0D0C1B8_9AGAM|nr:hypothetical protein PAXRUDRAFT_401311 [Paxillus rubicundulus Ve08.2h10]